MADRTGFCQAPKGYGRCGIRALPGLPIPLCASHGRDMLAALVTAIPDITIRTGRERARSGSVYYVQVDELVKIGFTTNMRNRMRDYPPNSTLLAAEPGTLTLEARRRDQFREHKAARNEWFYPHPDLLAHINTLRPADDPVAA